MHPWLGLASSAGGEDSPELLLGSTGSSQLMVLCGVRRLSTGVVSWAFKITVRDLRCWPAPEASLQVSEHLPMPDSTTTSTKPQNPKTSYLQDEEPKNP